MTNYDHSKPTKTLGQHKPASIQQYKSIFTTAAGLSVFIFIAFKVLAPFPSKWQKQSDQIREKYKLTKQYEQLIRQESALYKDFDTLNRQIQTEIPVEREESQFLTEIGKVASNTNVHIFTMNPRPFKDFGSFKELSVEIEMETNLGNLARFLYYIKKSSVVLVADRLSLQPKSERSALLKGHLVISTIFLKDK